MERLQWGFPIATALSLTCPKENDPSNAVDGLEGRKRIKDKNNHGIKSIAVEIGRRASEAKGPFSRREEGWELGEIKRK